MTTREATALALGGAGSVGAETLRQLARRGYFQRLLAADRDLKAAQRLAQTLGAEAVEIDVSDHQALVALMRRAQLVLNAAGPFVRYGVPVVRAAIEAHVDYAEVEHLTLAFPHRSRAHKDSKGRRIYDRPAAPVSTARDYGLSAT